MEKRRVVYLYPDEECQTLVGAMCDDGWNIAPTTDIDTAAKQLQEQDIGLGVIHFAAAMNGDQQERLERLMRSTPATAWVGITPAEMLPRLLKNRLIPGYFYDYHTEPVDWLRLRHSLGHAYGMAQASWHARAPADQKTETDEMIGVSERMQEIFHQIRKIAGVDASVMIGGESGTGKELAARAIHNQSERSNGPFIAINCGAISPTLIQSELFGHERGAFTGAHRRKIGRLEAADGGTIFLDEIADLPLDLQANLLRFLQERTIERVGGMDPIPLNVRVITATHVDLNDAVARGRFREDLYYRLNVIQLKMPALRERIEDIEPLAQYFFSIFARERNHNVQGFSRQALEAMRNYNWPGNVRELINRIRRTIIMCEGRLITPRELELDEPSIDNHNETLAQVRTEAEREAIKTSLRQSRNISEAARRLGIARMTLYRLMQKHHLNADAVHNNKHHTITDQTYCWAADQAPPYKLKFKSGGKQ